jgi:3-carboxy-cis,cis-muconate cycloisomerase
MSVDTHLLGPLFYGADAARLFSSEAQIAQMIRFELALTHALEAAGIAPAGTASACEQAARSFLSDQPQHAIAQGAILSGNIAIPFVKQLTSHIRATAGSAADFIHFGATSQDLLDTALVLSLRDFLTLTETQLQAICFALIDQIQQHRTSLLAGRTWLQQGPPITFSLKAAQWLSALLRHLERLAALRERVCVLQFGGAVGTLASLGSNGPAVTRELAARLALPIPDIPWHSQRDALAELSTFLALITGTLGKIARDLSLMLQHEVAEIHIAAPEGAGGSSTMPHKRNPVTLAVVLAASVRAPGLASTMLSAMVQEHERGLGGWHAEWQTLPELCCLTSGALANLQSTLQHLQIDQEAMRRNLDLLHGVALAESVSMRLGEAIGRPAAHRILEAASAKALQRNVDLLVILREDPNVTQHLSPEELEHALNPAHYLGSANLFIDQVLAHAARTVPPEARDALR